MSNIQMIKTSHRQFSLSHEISLLAFLTMLSSVSAPSMCFGQSSSDYHPGAGIKFHDLTGGSSSSSSSHSSSSGSTVTSIESSPSSTTSSSAVSSSPASAAVNTSSAAASNVTAADAAAGTETGEKGLGSFLKNVVRAGAQVGNIQQNYGSGQSYNNNYGNSPQGYSSPNANSYSGNSGYPHYNTSRPDMVQGGNPFPGRHSAFDGAQNQAQLSGNPMELVTNNPPYPIDGDLENLIPKEIHTKAWGPEVRRNGPLNGAEDNTHMF